MPKKNNFLSYTQDDCEILIAKNLQFSEQKIEFVTENGCGEYHENYSNHIIDWEVVKDHIFSKYDALWKELARH